MDLNLTGKRANFANIQAAHVVPTRESDVYRVQSGYEKVLAHRSRPPFAYTAKQDGKITGLDEDASMVEVTYKDGTVEVFQYGDDLSKNSGGGFDLRQHMELNDIQLGKPIKRGDVLAYNDEFFKPDPFSKQVVATAGITAHVAIVEDDITLEDCSAISKKTADRLAFHPTYERDIVISKSTNIHYIAKPGTELASIDPLVIFDEAEVPESMLKDGDAELINILADLNKAIPKAKHDGVVKKIECFYRMPHSEMSPSVAKAIRMAEVDQKKKAKFSARAQNKHKFHEPGALEKSDRIGTVNLDDDTIVLRFYIEHESPMGGGSKLIFSSSLKSVDGEVTETEIVSEDESIVVDARTSWRGVNNRLVYGIQLTGILTRVLEQLEENTLELFFDK